VFGAQVDSDQHVMQENC